MNNNVLIKISGLQMVDDTGDNVESMSAGKYYLKKTNIMFFMKIWMTKMMK